MNALFYKVIIKKDDEIVDVKLDQLIDHIGNLKGKKRYVESINKIQMVNARPLNVYNSKSNLEKEDEITGKEFQAGNRTVFIGKWLSDDHKPLEGDPTIGKVDKIDKDLFQGCVCLFNDTDRSLTMTFNRFGPKKNDIERYLSAFFKDEFNFKVILEPKLRENKVKLLERSKTITEIRLMWKTDTYNSANLFKGVFNKKISKDDKKIFNSFKKNTEQQQENARNFTSNYFMTTFKKSRGNKSLDDSLVNKLVSFINPEQDGLVTAYIAFKNPDSLLDDHIDLLKDGYEKVKLQDRFKDKKKNDLTDTAFEYLADTLNWTLFLSPQKPKVKFRLEKTKNLEFDLSHYLKDNDDISEDGIIIYDEKTDSVNELKLKKAK